MPGVTQAAVDGARQLVTQSTEELNKFNSMYGEAGDRAASSFSDHLAAGKERAQEKAQLFISGVKGAFDGLDGSLYGKQFAQGYIDGLESMKPAVARATQGAIVNPSKTATTIGLGIKSPSRVAMQYGEYYSEGFAEGVGNGLAGVTSSIKELIQAIIAESQITAQPIKLFDIDGITELQRHNMRNAMPAQVQGGRTVSNSYTYNQYNNSPKALSRLDIFQRTQAQLAGAKGAIA